MNRLLTRILTALLFPRAYLTILVKSEITRWKSLGKRPAVRFERSYDGRPILLLALYEKGVLRPDIRRLLAAARDAGLYILAVNTLRLGDPDGIEGEVDCYIERFNFGRDFGSYQTGFLHFFSRGWEASCPRLLMLNDSVYYSEERLPKFIADLVGSECEALGATENYEIEHHLGSFCIAIAGRVLRDPRFRRYWQSYRLSDVRPAVIRRGEMGLSQLLKRCVAAPGDFTALYDSRRTLKALEADAALVEFAIRNGRDSALVDWKRPSVREIAEQFRDRHLVNAYDGQELEITIDAGIELVKDRHYIDSVASMKSFLESMLAGKRKLDADVLKTTTIAHLMEVFVEGSQIHQNATLLLKMGLPIVKLDGMFRGMFSTLDLQLVTRLLPETEAAELTRQLLDRPFGGKTLIGWRRAAFYRGLI